MYLHTQTQSTNLFTKTDDQSIPPLHQSLSNSIYLTLSILPLLFSFHISLLPFSLFTDTHSSEQETVMCWFPGRSQLILPRRWLLPLPSGLALGFLHSASLAFMCSFVHFLGFLLFGPYCFYYHFCYCRYSRYYHYY